MKIDAGTIKMEFRIITALEEEFDYPKYKSRINYSGVGKVNAAITAMEVIDDYDPEVIINFGTCGALKPSMSGLYKCGIFQDRDLVGEFSPNIITTDETGCICSTGDRFLDEYPFKGVKADGSLEPDLVDMEAFAIASVCKKYNIKFVCYKFVTDYVNKESSSDWKANIGRGKSVFRKQLDDYISNTV